MDWTHTEKAERQHSKAGSGMKPTRELKIGKTKDTFDVLLKP